MAKKVFLILLALFFISCSGEKKEAPPVEAAPKVKKASHNPYSTQLKALEKAKKLKKEMEQRDALRLEKEKAMGFDQ